MSEYIIPNLIKKTITFRRLSNKNVLEYKIYGTFKDDTYSNGIRCDLLDTIKNPSLPSPCMIRIKLPYNDNATWKLPEDAYLDRDYQFRLYLDGFILSSMAYAYNRVTKLITLDTVMKEYNVNSKLEMEYYRDVITKSYVLENDCQITVKPIFAETYSFGTHNIII